MADVSRKKVVDIFGRNRGWLYLIIGTISFYIGFIYFFEEWEPILITSITLVISSVLIPASIVFGVLNICRKRVVNGIALMICSIIFPLFYPLMYFLPQLIFILRD